MAAEQRPVHTQQSTVCSTEAPLYNLSSCPPKKRFRRAADTAIETSTGVRADTCGLVLLPAKKRVQAFQFGEEELLGALLLQQHDGSKHHKREEIAASGSDGPDTSHIHDADARPAPLSMACGFCHATGDSEEAGPLMEYRNRSLIPAASPGSRCSTAVYVHICCAEWAPNVYYVTNSGGEEEEEQQQIRNVKSEISRARRLKCHTCGSRGAALGCCVKQCRKSFHYGCARQSEIDGRWETEEYLFLCSEHASCKFPAESKVQPPM